MSQLNTVSEAMDCSEPTVHFFGWNQEKHGLTDDLGQPKGELHEMTLDSMKHAIIMNRGEIQLYRIKIGLPASFKEYILILNLPRIVFVARYYASNFRDIIPGNLYDQMKRLSGLMNAKVDEIDGKDGPYEYGTPEGSELVIYYPEVILHPCEGLVPHDDMGHLTSTFKNSAIKLTTIPYPPETCTLVIEQDNTGDPATHRVLRTAE